MKKVVALFVLFLCVRGQCLCDEPAGNDTELADRAKAFINLLLKEDFPAAVARFDETMKKGLPADKLQEGWKTLFIAIGDFKAYAQHHTAKVQEYDVVVVTCNFERAAIDIKVVFNKANQVSGLFFLPSQPVVEYEAPSYVDVNSFEEKEVVVGAGEWALPGTLSLPREGGPFPAVILVHGSGPNDRDETLGPNKPFRDLACGLASRGIAVLRYEKRTKEHAMKFLPLMEKTTVVQESIEDALEAAALLRRMEQIDGKRIFVLGHSLGGYLAPRIGKFDATIAGLVIMASPTRPLEDLYLEQVEYILGADGGLSDEEKKDIEAVKKQVAKVKDASLTLETPASELPMGIPPAYWLDLRGYKPQEVALALAMPILILQGGRDYQVTTKDFDEWKKALGARANVAFKLYPGMNHLFIGGEGKCTPDEYMKPGHIAEEAVSDIAKWITGKPDK